MPAKQAPPQVPPTEKIQTFYPRLVQAAGELNSASDQLAKPIATWEAILKKLNLGISAWVELSGSDEGDYWWDRGIGYAKVKDTWGIAIRTRSGTGSGDPNEEEEQTWPFNEAPRWMRIEAVGKLPDLLEALLKQAEDTTKKIKVSSTKASEYAEALSKIAEDAHVSEQKGR